jgi:hypothetical protein
MEAKHQPAADGDGGLDERTARKNLFCHVSLLCLRDFGGATDRLNDPLISPATAKIVGHRGLDLGSARILRLAIKAAADMIWLLWQ